LDLFWKQVFSNTDANFISGFLVIAVTSKVDVVILAAYYDAAVVLIVAAVVVAAASFLS
jgi:hypothetical protein